MGKRFLTNLLVLACFIFTQMGFAAEIRWAPQNGLTALQDVGVVTTGITVGAGISEGFAESKQTQFRCLAIPQGGRTQSLGMVDAPATDGQTRVFMLNNAGTPIRSQARSTIQQDAGMAPSLESPFTTSLSRRSQTLIARRLRLGCCLSSTRPPVRSSESATRRIHSRRYRPAVRKSLSIGSRDRLALAEALSAMSFLDSPSHVAKGRKAA